MAIPVNRPLKIRWSNVLFFVGTGFGSIIGGIFYVRHYGLSPWVLFLMVFYVSATIFAITLGYHRLYAHAAFKANRLIECLVLFFGAAAFEQSAYRWASLHRTHHQFVDTEKDPYNIKRGFFHAHMGWLVFSKPEIYYENAKDLRANPLVWHQHEHYQKWALTGGLALPLLLGAATGNFLGTLIFAVGARIAIVHHSSFFINSWAHTFGSRHYDPDSSARDSHLGALLTNGEGYHNFHHRFPTDYRNGVRWYHWDPTKWLIWALSRVGWTWDLRKTSRDRIQEARRITAAKRAAAKPNLTPV